MRTHTLEHLETTEWKIQYKSYAVWQQNQRFLMLVNLRVCPLIVENHIDL